MTMAPCDCSDGNGASRPWCKAIDHATSAEREAAGMECLNAFLSDVSGRGGKKKEELKNKCKEPEEISDRRVGDRSERMINEGRDQCWIKIRRRLPSDYQDIKHCY